MRQMFLRVQVGRRYQFIAARIRNVIRTTALRVLSEHGSDAVLSIAGAGLQNKSRAVQDSALLISLRPALPLQGSRLRPNVKSV